VGGSVTGAGIVGIGAKPVVGSNSGMTSGSQSAVNSTSGSDYNKPGFNFNVQGTNGK
jgi:hypothetical protein